MQLHIFIFSTVVALPILPAQSLGLAVSTILCLVLQQSGKNIPFSEQEQEQ